jgi:hypothetical protein
MEPLKDKRATMPPSIALISDSHLPKARVLPPRPLTLEDVASAAVERLEALLEDVYLYGRPVPEPEVQWCHGARDILVTMLSCFPLERLNVDLLP